MDILPQTVEAIARVCHEANRAYCQTLGDDSQAPWDSAPEWQRESSRNGVVFHLENLDASASASHENWLRVKERDGWKYGPVKDVERKEHPCCVPFDQLPVEQRRKDYLFRAIVHAFAQPNR